MAFVFHGTPLTPKEALACVLAGRAACVSFFRPDDLVAILLLCPFIMFDHGAFSFWMAAMRAGREWDEEQRDAWWRAYYGWLEPMLFEPGRWAVIPDSPGAPSQVNDALLLGNPFGLGRGCTRDYKLRPIWRKLREVLGYGPRSPMPREPIVEMWIGITRDEKHRMAPSAHPWIRNRYPLIEIGWERHDCDDWIFNEFGVRLKHSGCTHCSYTSDEQWLLIKTHQPRDFAAAVAVDRLIRHGMPGVDGECFLHDSLTPLEEIDFEARLAERRGSLLGWSACSAGVCGI